MPKPGVKTPTFWFFEQLTWKAVWPGPGLLKKLTRTHGNPSGPWPQWERSSRAQSWNWTHQFPPRKTLQAFPSKEKRQEVLFWKNLPNSLPSAPGNKTVIAPRRVPFGRRKSKSLKRGEPGTTNFNRGLKSRARWRRGPPRKESINLQRKKNQGPIPEGKPLGRGRERGRKFRTKTGRRKSPNSRPGNARKRKVKGTRAGPSRKN